MILSNQNGLDQFYTNPNIAVECFETLNKCINVDYYDFHLEPSSGSGNFYSILDKKKRIGIDISPKCENIIKMDFFDYKPIKDKSYLVIGNPPFKFAVRFFNKCSQFCDCIGFILPRTFNKVNIQNKLDLNFELIYNKDIPLNSFNGLLTNAKTCFQIWKRTDKKRKVVICDKTHTDFSFLKYGPKNQFNQPTCPMSYDFAIKAYGGNCGEIFEYDVVCAKSFHWIKAHIDVQILRERFGKLDFSISKQTVRQDSLCQSELVRLYKMKYDKQ